MPKQSAKTDIASVDYLQSLADADLGNLVRKYLDGLQDTDYEGYTPRDITGIRRMLADMVIAHKAMQ